MACGRSPLFPVLLYHVGIPGFPGGFVGVDVFFVISGYLICGMIDADIRAGTFSLGNFYKRRILRILPALFVMFLVTSVLAYSTVLPVELEDYAKSLSSAVGFDLQHLLRRTRPDISMLRPETKPLLHTWSLGVEEQFYLIVPLLMLLAWRVAPRHARLLFAIAAALSFAAAVAVSSRNTSFAFYLTPFRAWELALGALLAIRFFPAPQTAFAKDACGAVGMLLLLGAILLGSPSAPLLLMTSLASIGATLVIASSERGVSMVGTTVVAAAGRLHRADLLFALSVALAANRVSAHRSVCCFRLVRPGDKTDAGRDLVRHRMAVVEICRDALPLEGQGSFQGRRVRRRLHRDGIGRCTLRPGAAPGGAPFRFPDRVVSIASYLTYDASTAFRSGQCYLATNRQQTRCRDLPETGRAASELSSGRRQPRRPSLVWPVVRDAGRERDAGDRQYVPPGRSRFRDLTPAPVQS